MRPCYQENEQLNLHTCAVHHVNQKVSSDHPPVKSNNLQRDEKALVRHALDMRTMAMLHDEQEFQKIQADMRDCGACTGFGAMQILNDRLSSNVSQALSHRRSSMNMSPIDPKDKNVVARSWLESKLK